MAKVALLLIGLLIVAAIVMSMMAPTAGDALVTGIESAEEIITYEEPVVVAQAVAAPQVGVSAPVALPPLYGDLPMTNHAEGGHQDEDWNARSIATFYDTGVPPAGWNIPPCKPVSDICFEKDFEVHKCQVNDGKTIALVIGLKVRQVITGFMASNDYWNSRCFAP